LGQGIRGGATVEEMQAAAGMNWRIERATVQFNVPGVSDSAHLPLLYTHSVKDRVVLYRSDNFHPLGVVSERYNEVQPSEALEFFRDMTEAGGYVLESAGTMMGGSRLFAAVKTAQGFDLPGGDEVVGRLLFATASCTGNVSYGMVSKCFATRASSASVMVFGLSFKCAHSASTCCLNSSMPKAFTKILIRALYVLSRRPCKLYTRTIASQ